MPVLVIRVQGAHAAIAFADCLTGWRMTAPKKRGAWWEIRTRGDLVQTHKLGQLLRVRFTVKCCGCKECAAQVSTERDCMTV